MYLIDTNIFLEVLLSQEKMDICKKILDSNIGNQYLSDFSLHSIGVILFKNGNPSSTNSSQKGVENGQKSGMQKS